VVRGGHDASRDDVPIFRMDRVLDAEAATERFEMPADFDVAAFLHEDGRPYRPGEARETQVRYPLRTARWIVERYGGPLESDGSARVRHVVADPRWVWRHVLQ
jgi:predicted DNA-binding transcriptional regulator YafY